MSYSRSLLCLVAAMFSLSVGADTASHRPLSDIVIYPERSAPATVQSLNDSVISSQLNAVVREVNVRVGQRVEQGDKLVKLDCLDFTLAKQLASAQLEAAQASEALAKSQLARNKELFNQALISQLQYDSREAEFLSAAAMVKQQRVALKQAEVHVDRCELRAPFAGVITERLVSKGQLASVGMPLVSIVDSEELELSAQISVTDYLQFSEVIEFTFDFGQRVPVKLHNAGGVINSQARNIETRLLFSEQQPLPGTAGRLHWRDPRPFVPARYVVKRNGQLGVFIADKGASEIVFHPLGSAVAGRPVEIGLPLSTLVVTEKLGVLNHGDKLN